MSARIGLWILVGGLGLILRMQPPGPSAAKPTPGAKAEGRRLLSLDGEWRFRREGANEWKSVCVPGAWQHHEGMDFQGVGWFEKAINVSLAPGRRLVIHFDAVATHVTVFWNDVQIGEHLGGWTPFRFDVTDLVRQSEPGQQQRLRLRVDEKVGHNTQGFLPIIQPHFGGFWQSVRLLDLPSIFFEDHRAALLPQTNPRVLKLSVPLVDRAPEKTSPDFNQVVVQWRPVGTTDWKEQAFDLTFATQHRRSGRLVPVGQEPDPALLNENVLADDQLRLHLPIPELPTWSPERPDLLEVRVAIPGYDAFTTRTALRTIEAEGANLKLNGQPLIVRGVLNWGYYPPRLAPSPDPEVWRADLRLIKSWGFNLMKCCLWVPPKRLLEIADEEGVLIWMEYPTWHPKIDQKHREELLREYAEFFEFDRNHPAVILRSLTCETGHQADLVVIQELYDLGKRLVPGALIVDDSSWIEWIRVGDFYDDHPYGNNHTWLATLRRLQDYVARSKLGVKPLLLGEAIAADTWVNPSAIDELIRTRGSSDAASTPAGSLSGPTHGPRPYWAPIFLEANRQWLARMEQVCGGPVDQQRLQADSLRYAWLMRKYQIEAFRRTVPGGGYVVSVIRDFPLASMGLIDYAGQPKWSAADWSWHSAAPVAHDPWPGVRGPELAALPGGPDLRVPDEAVRTAPRLTPELLDELERGGKVLLLPDGKEGSLPLRAHWFLRGAPFVNTHHPLIQAHPTLHALLVDQQHFDLAGDVVPDLEFLDEITPLLLLWDNHDIPVVKTHGLVFETRVGQGRLLISALRHGGPENAAGQRLLELWRWHLVHGSAPRNALTSATIERLRGELREKRLSLVGQLWRFKPDPNDIGVAERWATTPLDESWKPIKIGQHWEGQGYPNLDGWAWYRLEVTIPAEWPEQDYHLHCEGLDDYGEFFVDGRLIGTMGDRENRKTAFEDRASPPLKGLRPGARVTLAVRVYDWYGAGGLHRPLTLSTEPLRGTRRLLR